MKNILLSLLLLVVGSGWLGAQTAAKVKEQAGSLRDDGRTG